MHKHAYLIMAHNELPLLNKLLSALDDPRNDIYLHLDQKADFEQGQVYHPVRAGIFFVPRMNVVWGGDSQVKCELALLRAAVPHHYDYYHLLSGVDLPLKCQDEIHDFFARHAGRNFIKIDWAAVESGSMLGRIRRYRFLQNRIGRSNDLMPRILRLAERISLLVQTLLRIDRLKNCPKKIYKGSNWFSITHAMAHTILQEEPFIRRYCFHSLAPDEIFVQTVAMNSPLRDTVADEYLRCIDWERGAPYTFRSGDYAELMRSNALFARKFSDHLDPEITAKIVAEVTKHEA